MYKDILLRDDNVENVRNWLNVNLIRWIERIQTLRIMLLGPRLLSHILSAFCMKRPKKDYKQQPWTKKDG
ncbi:hypothetical protein F8388_024490 [Cannabis sativa]|uniref:Uncharacterized protein n=1 Tax=Cannabis sativa TaxID=3483 RepID=A0A7J6DZS2_CANSA|nr:hypothetical protein F8388_024490 [Cannabis sativa]